MNVKKTWPFPGLPDAATVEVEWVQGEGAGKLQVSVAVQPNGSTPVTVTVAEHDGVRLTMPPSELMSDEQSWRKSGPEVLAILCTCTPVVKLMCDVNGWTPSPVTERIEEWALIVADIEEFFSIAFVQES